MLVVEGDVEGGGEGEGGHEVFEGVLVGGPAVGLGHEVLGDSRAGGVPAGDEEGLDVMCHGGSLLFLHLRAGTLSVVGSHSLI